VQVHPLNTGWLSVTATLDQGGASEHVGLQLSADPVPSVMTGGF